MHSFEHIHINRSKDSIVSHNDEYSRTGGFCLAALVLLISLLGLMMYFLFTRMIIDDNDDDDDVDDFNYQEERE